MPSPSQVPVFPTALQLLTLLTPVILAGRLAVQPRPAVLDMAAGVMRFSLGHAKWVLLALPFMNLSQMIWNSDPQCWSSAVAWVGLLAGVMTFYFGMTGTIDLMTGFRLILRRRNAAGAEKEGLLTGFDKLGTARVVIILLPAALVGLNSTAGWIRLPDILHSLISSRTKTAVTVFQEARVLSDFHVVTLIAGLACLIGLPRSHVFLRQPQRWKAVICLCLLGFSIAMLLTREVPHP